MEYDYKNLWRVKLRNTDVIVCKVCEIEFIPENKEIVCDICHESMWVNEDDI